MLNIVKLNINNYINRNEELETTKAFKAYFNSMMTLFIISTLEGWPDTYVLFY